MADVHGIYSAFIELGNLHPKRNYSVGEVGHTVLTLKVFNANMVKRDAYKPIVLYLGY